MESKAEPGRLYALKAIMSSMGASTEFEFLKRLSDCPHFTKCHGAYLHGDDYYVCCGRTDSRRMQWC